MLERFDYESSICFASSRYWNVHLYRKKTKKKAKKFESKLLNLMLYVIIWIYSNRLNGLVRDKLLDFIH